MLDICALDKTYGNGVRVLRGVTLQVGAGVFGLLGPNGAGKSTLLRTVATLQRPDGGRVRLDGIDVLDQPAEARRRIGYLPQDFGLYPQVTAEALLNQFALYKGILERGLRQRRVAECLERVNLWPHRQQALGGFSGGMRQRFGIAQAIIASPRLLIVDEPTAGLDPAERIRLQNLLLELAAERIVLLSTHIVEDVKALCADIAVLAAGEIVCRGAPQQLVDALHGRVWQRELDADAPPPSGSTLINTRVSRGRRVMRVLAETAPAGFAAATAELDDVYFSVLEQAQAVAA